MTPLAMFVIVVFVVIVMFTAARIAGLFCRGSAAHYPERPLVRDVDDGAAFGGEYE